MYHIPLISLMTGWFFNTSNSCGPNTALTLLMECIIPKKSPVISISPIIPIQLPMVITTTMNHY